MLFTVGPLGQRDPQHVKQLKVTQGHPLGDHVFMCCLVLRVPVTSSFNLSQMQIFWRCVSMWFTAP